MEPRTSSADSLTARRASPWAVALAGQFADGLAMLGAGLMLPGHARPGDFAWALAAGAGSAVGTVFLYRGLARGRIGVVAPVSGIGAALVPVFVGVSLGERLGTLTWIGVRDCCTERCHPICVDACRRGKDVHHAEGVLQ